MAHTHERAAVHILDWLHRAETSLVDKAVVTFNGEAGAVRHIRLDESHGLCFTLDEDPKITDVAALDTRRWYPVSTIRHVSQE
jgi:hypothetical protein